MGTLDVMRAFACGACRSLVYFEDDHCVTCGSSLAYERAAQDLVVVATDEPRRCANQVLAVCNWLADAPGGLCGCCALTRTRPAAGDLAGMAAFALTEAAKRRLIYQLDHLGLPSTPRRVDSADGLAFDLLSSSHERVLTGHAEGVITLDLAEGYDAHRESLRVQLAEPYRTLLGHLRHEIGHWYWAVLIDGTPYLERFRTLMGDERADYAHALEQHYGTPGDTAWMQQHVSQYAAAHPGEDWAESFAHYLHMQDTLETAAAWRMRADGPDIAHSLGWDAEFAVRASAHPEDFDALARAWISFELCLNEINRSMGHDDLYPFRLVPAVLAKLRFVHEVVTAHRAGPSRMDS